MKNSKEREIWNFILIVNYLNVEFSLIDIGRSSTRKEELLISKSELDSLWQLRNMFTDSTDFTERFIRKLKRSKSNKEFFQQLQKAAEESTKTGKPII